MSGDLPALTRRARLSRRAVVAVATAVLAVGVAAFGLAAAASAPERVAAGHTVDPALDHVPAPVLVVRPDPVVTAPLESAPPETEPAPAPPPRVAPAPKKAPSPQPAPQLARPGDGSETAQLVALVNRYRAANGLPALEQAGDATAKAQRHSEDMAAQGRIFHSSSLSSGISGGWSSLGENVGMGGSVGQIESMFEASSAHRDNLLNPSFNQLGVGVAYGSDGALYVTEVFVGR